MIELTNTQAENIAYMLESIADASEAIFGEINDNFGGVTVSEDYILEKLRALRTQSVNIELTLGRAK